MFDKDQPWLLVPSDDGTAFTLVPRMENPYAGKPARDEKMATEWGDVPFPYIDDETDA